MDEDNRAQTLWRLGHRRPWWHWNVITLLALLFALVWARELLRIPQAISWAICIGILIAWWVFPAIVLRGDPFNYKPKDRPSHDPPEVDDML